MSQFAPAAFDCLQTVASAILVLQGSRIVWANRAASALTGYETTELARLDCATLLAPAWREKVERHSCIGEVELLAATGETIWVDVSLNPYTTDGQTFEVATLVDIRELKRLQQTLKQRESTYRGAIEANLDGFYLLQSIPDSAGEIVDFVFTDVNSVGETIIPASKAELIGRRVSEIFPHERGLYFIKRYAHVATTGEPLDEDFELVRVNGERYWFHHQVIAVSSGIAVFIRDITDRKETETALLESERRYRALFDQANDYVTLIGLDGRYLLVNQQFAAAIGYEINEIIGRYVDEFMPPDQSSGSRAMREAVIAGQDVPLYDRAFIRRDGSDLLCEINLTLVRDADGNPLYVQSILRDVTWRREAENALRANEERYRLISELISDYAYAFRVEPDGEMVQEWITDSYTRITGYRYEEIEAQGLNTLFHPDEANRVQADLKRALNGETVSGEYRIVTKSGETRWLHLLRQPIWDAQHTRVIRLVGVAQDITERKQSEEELRKSEEQYRLIAENASDIIVRGSLDGICTYISSACRSLLGYEPAEIIGTQVMALVHHDDHLSLHAFFNLLRQSAEPLTVTCRILHKRGDYGWFEFTAQAIRDPQTSQPKEYITVARDIGQRKQMESMLHEQERLRYELQKEQELNEVKSNLMRTISHEFRTPLALIVTATDLLDMYIDRLDAQQRSERFQAIRVQVKRLSDMLDDITFVVQGTLHHMLAHPSHLNLETYCRNIVDEIQMSIGKNHQIAFTTDGQLANGIADKALIVRIIGNLLSNAVKYSPEHSAITVSLFRSDGDAVLEVRDQGIGIAPEDQKRIFDPFYRGSSVLDSVGGTGLGLSIVKDCVNLHGGSIEVDSAPGKGATFIVRLPQITA